MDHLHLILLLGSSPLFGLLVHKLVRRLPFFLALQWQIALPYVVPIKTRWCYITPFVCTLIAISAQNSLLHCLVLMWAASLLMSLACIDWQYQWLPDYLTFPLLWTGLAANLFAVVAPLHDAVLGAMLGYLLLWGVDQLYQLLRQEPGIGQGDFKLLAALGAWGGWHLLPMILLLATSIALLFSLPLYTRTTHWARTRLAFGSYLAVIGWSVLTWRTYLP